MSHITDILLLKYNPPDKVTNKTTGQVMTIVDIIEEKQKERGIYNALSGEQEWKETGISYYYYLCNWTDKNGDEQQKKFEQGELESYKE